MVGANRLGLGAVAVGHLLAGERRSRRCAITEGLAAECFPAMRRHPDQAALRSWQFTDAAARDSTGQFTTEVHDAINQVLAALDEPKLEDMQPESADLNAVNT